ncbi:copper-translocating P-type ATPase [Corynebacterium diphtheriae]|uniref:heavy metal translocating P-type ATPase n=1 Tax=Corynebacterium diphtheriae TaxID=1717 RepID=UPI0002468AEC|nr:heavy metal translocating P-type ATPase [Corynebacterium diphtheriae]AEX82182.1 putative cation-transporting P-type ATPase [Corynebacterium diphtheriae HC04]AEX84354.1 putative cation-transporting P-type ATPase [Corynebacterium diphtheriae VA01]CAB0485438.1 copper-translocating P-type ATPase [Corynebacterium diphtheriae]CAB0622044.1 copper-translocating P-type ATPase [Corynebacterium diphtheriae]CAB0991063.1 copper-translocating P-type ATPase [Corynebacterium diphtheriae]
MTNAAVEIDFGVTGMTCTSCSARVERKLNKVAGVEATVNYATETASVRYDPASTTPAQLIDVIRGAGYDAFEVAETEPATAEPSDTARDHHAEELKTRLIYSAILALPVFLMSMFGQLQFNNWQWLAFALTSPVYFWGGWPFHRATLRNLRHGSFTMDTLISLGTSAAYLWSVWALFIGNAGDPAMRMHMSFTAHAHGGMDEIYLESAAMVIVFLLLGRWFETRAKGRSGEALRSLLNLGAKDAAIIRDNREVRIPIQSLQVGDVFVVRPGEKIATDGVVVEGTSAVDQSMITGESVPVEVAQGSHVTGATMNTSGRLLVTAQRVGADTTLAAMGRLVAEAQSNKAPVQKLVDKISQIFVPAVIVISLITLAVHLATGSATADAFAAAVAVLIIACPCALGLATPTALLVGTGRGAQMGLVIKGPEVLEQAGNIDTVVLDKTGTITTGDMQVRNVYGHSGWQEQDVLRLAGAVEQASEHPIARAITAAAVAQTRTGTLPKVTDFNNQAGHGVAGTVKDHRVWVGRPADDEATQQVKTAENEGATCVVVRIDDHLAGVISVRDTVKVHARLSVEKLTAMGLTPVLLTGDNAGAAAAVAREVGIPADRVIAGVLPENKVQTVEQLQREGRVVAMVGDGVNDAAALTQADLGLAMGAGTDVAIEASDITIMNNDPRSIANAINLSRRSLRTIKGNLFWAFAYNVILIPVAALGLLNPMFAGAAMALSSVFVVTNSLRLRSVRSVFS